MLTNRPALSHPRPSVKSSQIPQGWPWEAVSALHVPSFALCSWLFRARLHAAIPSTSFGKALNRGLFRSSRGVSAGVSAGANPTASVWCSRLSPHPAQQPQCSPSPGQERHWAASAGTAQGRLSRASAGISFLIFRLVQGQILKYISRLESLVHKCAPLVFVETFGLALIIQANVKRPAQTFHQLCLTKARANVANIAHVLCITYSRSREMKAFSSTGCLWEAEF